MREPAREVVHYDGGDERLAQASGEADERIGQQGGLDHVKLIPALRDAFRIDPVPRVDSAADRSMSCSRLEATSEHTDWASHREARAMTRDRSTKATCNDA